MNRNNNQILNLVLDNTQNKITTSSLLQKTNINHSRLKKITEILIHKKLVIKFEKNYVITEKGRIYLEKWKNFVNLAESFGLEI